MIIQVINPNDDEAKVILNYPIRNGSKVERRRMQFTVIEQDYYTVSDSYNGINKFAVVID